MNIVVKGRNVEVPDHYRVHVTEKLARIERYDQKAVHYDVELFHERNPRQSKSCQRVEITGSCRGQVVRAEACGSDFYAALDAAVSKLDNRLRRVADRHKVHQPDAATPLLSPRPPRRWQPSWPPRPTPPLPMLRPTAIAIGRDCSTRPTRSSTTSFPLSGGNHRMRRHRMRRDRVRGPA